MKSVPKGKNGPQPEDPNKIRAPAGRTLMAPLNGTILNLLVNAPSRASAPLFAFLPIIAKNVAFQFQPSKTVPQLKTPFSILASCRPPGIGQQRVRSDQMIFGLVVRENHYVLM
jgi:hypothetical protein